MNSEVSMVPNEGSANEIRARFKDAGIPIDDDDVFILIGGVFNFMNQNPEVWALFKDFRLGINYQSYNLADPNTHAVASHEIGQSFKKVMDDFCLMTAALEEDHFTFIGLFTIILATYPAAYQIIEVLLDNEAAIRRSNKPQIPSVH